MDAHVLPVQLDSSWYLIEAHHVREVLGAEPWLPIPRARAELPGVGREAINLEIADGYLTITANRKEQEQEQSVELSRVIALPDTVSTDKVTAAYADGVLTVTLPKQEQAKPRKIEIAVS